jgi:phospholipid/cholesterol/gamma-HCH transport system substrate-binding protein
MNRTTLDLIVGFFVAIGLAALAFLALKVANLTSSFNGSAGGYHLEARFDNIGGLKARAPVKSAGVVVGRVEEIKFDNTQFQAAVMLKMDSRYSFPKDSSVKILTSGLLGEQYIDLEAGGDPKKLADNDTIKLTQSAVVLENLIGQFLYNKASDTSAPTKGGGK